ncbi:MAG: hypothetical protein K6E14_06295 [Paludibacteraceae bacterium]|nr:hypothetical protein [Paludibacteraceae bacterium]
MKKILIFLMFSVFFSSCPLMEDTSEGATVMRTFEIWANNNSSFDVNCNVIAYFDTYIGKGGHRDGSSEIDKEKNEKIVYFDLEDLDSFKENNDTLNLSKVFNEFFYNKQFVVTSLSGDTLANWHDGSAVFDLKYWFLEPQENGDVHCTLQLTDEVLKLK